MADPEPAREMPSTQLRKELEELYASLSETEASGDAPRMARHAGRMAELQAEYTARFGGDDQGP
ncbi:MAG: hypothetical protein JWN95_4000 [Frankiales bacterium]|nr:hypothetical protein [Frankiales bacterium]